MRGEGGGGGLHERLWEIVWGVLVFNCDAFATWQPRRTPHTLLLTPLLQPLADPHVRRVG